MKQILNGKQLTGHKQTIEIKSQINVKGNPNKIQGPFDSF